MSAVAHRLAKSAVDGVCLVIVLPAAAMCAAEAKLGPRAETVFSARLQTLSPSCISLLELAAVLVPDLSVGVSIEERIVAVAIVDQLGAALAADASAA